MAETYPSELIWRWMLPDGTRILIRPIRPEDRWIERESGRQKLRVRHRGGRRPGSCPA